MTPQPHRLGTQELTALARGDGGADVVRSLVAVRRSRTLQLIRLIAGAATADDAPARQAYRALGEIHRAAPAAVDRVLAHPPVGAWATRAALELTRTGHTDAGPLAAVAAAAAVRGRVATKLSVPEGQDLVLPSLGVLTGCPGGLLAVRPGADGVDIGGLHVPADWSADGRNWRAVPRVVVVSAGHRARFLIEQWGTHPGADIERDQAPDLPAWQAMLDDAWHLLVRHHTAVADELAAGISVLGPMPAAPTGSSSATVADAFGCILVSFGPTAEAMAVALTHELRHNKLLALLDLFPLFDVEPGERFYAPWRPDPRPLPGLLHGTYAYAGVTSFWRVQRWHEPTQAAAHYAHTEFARWRMSALSATRILLESGRLTAVGTEFVATMAQTLERWCTEPVPAAALREADQIATDHRDSWDATYGDR